jgi:hypothetical protein
MRLELTFDFVTARVELTDLQGRVLSTRQLIRKR